jgi:hypothetical protein
MNNPAREPRRNRGPWTRSQRSGSPGQQMRMWGAFNPRLPPPEINPPPPPLTSTQLLPESTNPDSETSGSRQGGDGEERAASLVPFPAGPKFGGPAPSPLPTAHCIAVHCQPTQRGNRISTLPLHMPPRRISSPLSLDRARSYAHFLIWIGDVDRTLAIRV